MDESRHGLHTGKLILRVFLVYFLVSLFILGWLLWPFLSTIVVAATVTGAFNPLYRMLNRKLPSVVAASLATWGVVFLLLFILYHFTRRHPGDHFRTAGGHRFSDPDGHLSRQLSESGRTV